VANKIATEQKGIPVAVLVVALVVILGAGFFLYLDRASHRSPPRSTRRSRSSCAT